MCLEKCFVNNWCLCLNDKPFCALWSLIPRLVLDPRKPFSSPSIVIIRKCTFQAFRPKIRTQDLSQFIPKPIIVKIRYTFQRFQSFPRGIGTVAGSRAEQRQHSKNHEKYTILPRCPLLDFKLSPCTLSRICKVQI